MESQLTVLKQLVVLFIAAFLWFFSVAWVNSDTQKTGRNTKFWNTIFFFFSPISLIIYLSLSWKNKLKKRTVTPRADLVLLKGNGEPLFLAQGGGQESLTLDSVKDLIKKALNNRSTDIHLSPKIHSLLTRFRIDGILHDGPSFPERLGTAILSSFKVLAQVDIAERRKAQDGSFIVVADGNTINFRVSTTSSLYGETMVIRILDSKRGLINLNKLGLSPQVEEECNSLIASSHGMILVAGPSGNGKTTTLYAILNRVNTGEKNVISIEDPIEYELAGVTQIPIHSKTGVTFAGSLRTVLRQDPDVIMIGEIRDLETAEIAFRASLTGHLVLSTLHATEAVEVVARLLDMGLKPNFVSSSLIGVLAQRLIRILCPKCKKSYKPQNLEELYKNGLKLGEKDVLYKPVGCKYCRNTGYKGRIGVFELLIIDKEIRTCIDEKASKEDIFSIIKEKGMLTMKEDGWEKVKQGITTIEEVERVLK